MPASLIPHIHSHTTHHPPHTHPWQVHGTRFSLHQTLVVAAALGSSIPHTSHHTYRATPHATRHTPHTTHILPRQRHGTRVSCRNPVFPPYKTHHTHITLARSRNQVFMSPNIGRCCGIGCQQPSIILTSSFGILGVMGGRSLRTYIYIYVFTRIYKYLFICMYGILGVMGGRSLRTCICIYVFTRIYKYLFICIYGILGVMGGGSWRMCICIACMCMYIHTYTYIYTYTYR